MIICQISTIVESTILKNSPVVEQLDLSSDFSIRKKQGKKKITFFKNASPAYRLIKETTSRLLKSLKQNVSICSVISRFLRTPIHSESLDGFFYKKKNCFFHQIVKHSDSTKSTYVVRCYYIS